MMLHLRLLVAFLLLPTLAFGQTTNSRTHAGDGTPITDTVSGRLDVQVQNPVTVTGSVTADTEIPAAAALGDAAANPTIPSLGVYVLCFNGTTWDRCRGTVMDTDDNSIAASQVTSLVIGQSYMFNGAAWVRTLGNATDGLLVNLGANNDVTVTGTVTVTDGSGALNVIVDSSALPSGAATSALQDGIIKDGAGDTTQANVSSGRLHVDGSGVTQPVSGTVTVTDGSGALNVICDSGCGGAASFEDNDAFVADTTPVNVMGALYDTTPPSITDGNAGAVRMNSNRQLLVDGSGVTQPVSGTVTVTDGSGALNVIVDSLPTVTVTDGSGALNVIVDSGSITANAGTNLNTSALALDATITGRLPAGASPGDDESNTNTNLSRIGTYNFCYDGSTWDRCRGTTIDSDDGTIAASQSSSLVINENYVHDGSNWVRKLAGRCEREEPIYVSIDQTTGTQLVTGTASERIYICSLHVNSATAQNVALVDGTGSVCATGTSGVEGFGGATAGEGWNFAANGGVVLPATTQSYGRTTTNADNLCLLQSGAGQVSGGLTYVSLAP